MRERIGAFDFLRTVCCLGIFLFHLSIALAEYDGAGLLAPLPDQTGFLFVTCFFVLSGALTEYHYGREDTAFSPSAFYRRRAKTLLPPFYTAFFLVFLASALRHGTLRFFDGPAWCLVFSLIGMDGYLSASFPTCYLIGEWFLGGLILMYLLYPLLRALLRKHAGVTCAAVLILYLLTADRALLAVSPLANPFSCLVSFLAGILFARYFLTGEARKRRNLTVVFICLSCVGMLLAFLPYPWAGKAGDTGLMLHIHGMTLFLLLFALGERTGSPLWEKAAGYTYCFYLVHHLLTDRICCCLGRAAAGPALAVSGACISFAASAAAAALLQRISRLPSDAACNRNGKKRNMCNQK